MRGRARYVDTVIGKMGGVIAGESECGRRLRHHHLRLPAAFLVEAFDRILVSRVGAGLHPGCRCCARSTTLRHSRMPSSWATTRRTPWPASSARCWGDALRRPARGRGRDGLPAYGLHRGVGRHAPSSLGGRRRTLHRARFRGLRRRSARADGQPASGRHHRACRPRPASQAGLDDRRSGSSGWAWRRTYRRRAMPWAWRPASMSCAPRGRPRLRRRAASRRLARWPRLRRGRLGHRRRRRGA